MGNRIVTGEFETEISLEHDEVEVSVEFESSVFVDNNYGADADGNRGIKETFLDELLLKVIWGEKDITEFLEKFLPKQFSKLEDLATEKTWENYDEED